jgi:pilus assembly protein FimV
VRNLGLKVALWLTALLPINSFALGLGEIEVRSFLNQPLNAEIQVISARPGEIDDLLVSLASREAFTRAGLERPRHLSDLKFTVKTNEAGDTAVIVVSTRASIKEPFLNFLIEADWSKGRLLREFTVLLDPPFYADQPAAVETLSESSPPAASEEAAASDIMPTSSDGADMSSDEATGDGTITEPIALAESSSAENSSGSQTSQDSQTSSPPSSSEYVAEESQNIIQGDVLVVKGDTLWSIASLYKDDDHSMSQVMLAFQRTNPDAFTNGNINNMKVGAVLRAPSADELDALSQQAAYAEALVQNGLWDEYVARVTGVSPAIGGAADDLQSSVEGESVSQGELSLLMPAEGDSNSTGTGDSADIEQLRTKLALAEEDLEASRIENEDLESRISELQARLSKVEELQKMVEIEDDSLAQLQAGQNGNQTVEVVDGESEDSMAEDATDSATAGENAVEETIKADEEALLEELLAEEAAAQAEEQAALQQADMTDGESDAAASDDVVEEQPLVAIGDDDQMVDEETQPKAVIPPPAPVIITESTSAGGDSMLDGILPTDMLDMIPSMGSVFSNPIILAAVGGVIVLLLVLVVVKRRKAAQDDDFGVGGDSGGGDLFAGDDEDELTPIHLTEPEDSFETDIIAPTAEDMAPEELPVEAVEEDQDVDQFAATAIVSAVDMPEPEAPAPAVGEQDDVLNEVDVYLAYGLYDNAEDLLKSSLVENPERADYRSKLLDTYFATKKSDAFVKEAENLKGMGNLASPYWDRVQIMGYELAPDNALFSDAKDSGLSAADLEIAKPQEADFDLGASEDDDTNFSSADFNLGEEDTDGDFVEDSTLGEAGDLESTQQVSATADKSPMFDDDDDAADDLLDLPDDLGDELEFSIDDEPVGDDTEFPGDLELPGKLNIPGDEVGELDMLDDLDLDAFDEDVAEQAADNADTKLDLGIDDEDLELDDEVQVRAADDVDTALDLGMDADDDLAGGDFDEDDIDLGMDDTGSTDAIEPIEEAAGLELDIGDGDEDISIIDFGGDDFVEPTEMMPSISSAEIDDDDDDFVLDDDDEEGLRTGTFAPGDFEEPAASVDSLADLDDMDDLMLPDDVDEVSTKLDLARAFIDMGDTEGARGSLEEVISEGSAEQKAEAKTLLDQI